MNRKIAVFVVILLISTIFLYCYMTDEDVQIWIARHTEEELTEGNIYSDLNGLSERLQEEIMCGSDSFTVYLQDMDMNEIYRINELLDGVFGRAESYQQLGEVGNRYIKVRMMISHTSNYYVYKACRNREPIPDTDRKALEMYEVVMEILNCQIRDGMTDYEKEIALHDYLVENCKYSEVVEQSAESDIYRAYGALVNKEAVCNGYAEAMQLLLACVDVESELVIGFANGVEHAWNMVCLEGDWYHLDATWNDPLPDQGALVNHPYFNVTDDMMADSHIWDREKYPEAASIKNNYYVYHNSYFEDFESCKTAVYDVMIHGQQKRYEVLLKHYRECEDAMRFLFEDNDLYKNISWQTFRVGSCSVLILQAE